MTMPQSGLEVASMSIVEVRKLAKRRLDRLPPEEVRAAAEFIEFLTERSGSSSPLPRRAPLNDRIKRAKQDFEAGRGTAVSELKRKY
jgi:hypothetical protein